MALSYLIPKLKEGESVDLSLFSPRERVNIRLYGLECKDWTPRDAADFKQQWKQTSTTVYIRGQLSQAKSWCRTNCYHQDFDIELYARQDGSHTVHFRRPEDAMLFKITFSG